MSGSERIPLSRRAPGHPSELLCYRAKLARTPVRQTALPSTLVSSDGPFGAQVLEVRGVEEVCVPGLKDVPNLAQLGFPWCDVDAEGNGTLGKVAGTGGAITLRTTKEQLLYEVTDPGGYITPDVVADLGRIA